MATIFCGAAPVVARFPFCRPEEDPFLLLESTQRSEPGVAVAAAVD
jgi:hypothetical protein